MKIFLIAGEASGDLHAAHLMRAIKQQHPDVEFCFYGGDEMQAVGGTLLCHYRDLAYMGFVQVALHLRTILRGMAQCKRQIAEWNPDALILVDYPGFNLKMARFVKDHAICPVYYYISPKIWAWKEHRIHAIRRDVDRLFSILPFEIDFLRGNTITPYRMWVILLSTKCQRMWLHMEHLSPTDRQLPYCLVHVDKRLPII